MQDFDGLGQLVPVIIAVIWVVAQVVRVVFRGKKAPQQPPGQRAGRAAGGPEGGQAPGRHGEVLQQGAGREIRDFLERLRDEAESTDAERRQRSPDPLAADQGFDAPGHVAEAAANEDGEEAHWDDYDWEQVEPEPIAVQPSPPPPPLPFAARPAAATPLQASLEGKTGVPFPEAAKSSEESLFSAGWSSLGGEAPSWLSISDIVNTAPSETIRGVSIDEAMALREILAKPRASARWRPGGFYNV